MMEKKERKRRKRKKRKKRKIEGLRIKINELFYFYIFSYIIKNEEKAFLFSDNLGYSSCFSVFLLFYEQ
jgi:hypothetical protein